jgi:hypothetical protein
MSDPKHPVVGDMAIDATDVTPAPLTTDQIQRKIKVRAGFSEAVASLKRVSPTQIQGSGISADEVQRAIDLKVQYDRCEELLPAVEELFELLRETRIEYGHQISIILGEVAYQARRRADRDPKGAEILGTISDLLDYVSAPAIKGTKTKAKKADPEITPAPPKENGAPARLLS